MRSIIKTISIATSIKWEAGSIKITLSIKQMPKVEIRSLYLNSWLKIGSDILIKSRSLSIKQLREKYK